MKQKALLIWSVFMSTLIVSCGESSNSSASLSSSSNSSVSSSSSASSSRDVGSAVEYDSIIFRLRGDDTFNVSDYGLWIWEDGLDGELYVFNETDVDDYGGFIELPSTTWTTRTRLNYIVRQATSWVGQSPDIFFYLSDFEPFMVDGVINVYLILGESEYFFTEAEALGDIVTLAEFTDWRTVRFETTGDFVSYALLENNVPIREGTAGVSGQTITLDADVNLQKNYRVQVQFKATDTKFRYRTVLANPLFATTKFEQNYTYTGNDLGLTLSNTQAMFKIWAPTSSEVNLKLYASGTPASISKVVADDVPLSTTPLIPGEKGTYAVTLPITTHTNLNGRYYTFQVVNALGRNEIIDPYAKTTGVNGIRGMILDLSTTNPTGWNQVAFDDITSPTDLLVYELHVRDLTADASWTGTEINRGKFLGLIEEDTTYTDTYLGQPKTVTTGFDHLKELGFNAIQILPFYDQANNELSDTYNWGYNPLNYNVLEGQYATNPYDGNVRVEEFKQVVQAFSESGIRVIKDVVYNHVAAATSSNFNVIVPGYFFRLNADGTYSDGAGVGNETKTERPMMRKFIVDSVKFWATEYKIKGFRFDLMALIDVTTMQQVKDALHTIDPDIVVYGEPWKGFTDTTLPLDQQSNAFSVYNRLSGIGAFNDAGRNGIRGENTWSGNQWGWMQKGDADNQADVKWINAVKGMMAGRNGSFYDTSYVDPRKTLNYASVHDNLTLFDQVLGTTSAQDAPKVSVGINALVSFSLGMPLIHAGEEIMRTKVAAIGDDPETYYSINGVNISHNSYQSPDSTNAFKWNRKVNYYDYFERYVAMIELRETIDAFKYSSASVVSPNQNAKMGFWDGPLSYSTIAAWFINPDNTTYYVFANARQQVTLGNLTSNITWDGGGVKVQVLFDSTGKFPVGTQLTNTVLLESYQVLLVKRL